MTDRQLPKWSELKPLLRPKPITVNRTDRRLEKALTIADLRAIARRRTPRSVFDYTDGAAEAEISLQRARRLFAEMELQPSILRNVSEIDLGTSILGGRSELPFAFAPTGFTRMMNHEGESAVVKVAERIGIPYALSTMGTTSIEDVAAAAPKARKWFQLYVWKDRDAGEDLVKRSEAAGYEALMLTVDVPVAGARLRDVRNGFTIPPSLTAKTVLDASLHPAWWANLLTTRPLTFASLSTWDGTVAELLDKLFDPTMTIDDLTWLRSIWSGPLIVKGIQTVEDARRVVDAGADAIVLSNHGGRQLDRAPTPLRILPDVRQAIGTDAEIYLDTGIMSGADIVASIALGADACLVGRAYLYGLMAGGERGVARAAEILTKEVRRTMALLGVSRVADLNPSHVRLP
jgi:L-lactate dehydrogenase (cytochrome)